jgi:Skp family chaperone for outer membrane proteins
MKNKPLHEVKIKLVLVLFFYFLSLLLFLVDTDLSFAKDENPSLKFGYVDVQKFLNESDAGMKAKSELKVFIKEKQALIDEQGRRIDQLKQDMERKPYERYRYEPALKEMLLQYQQIVTEAQETVKKKEQELTSSILQELIWAIKRFGKKEGYTLILTREGLSLLEKKLLADYKNDESIILYKDKDYVIDNITFGVEDFDNITQKVIAFFNSREGGSSEQKVNFTKETKKEPSKIEISVEVLPELFPVVAKFLAEGNEHFNIPHLVRWKIRNEGSQTTKLTVTCEIPEWTPPLIKRVDLAPYEYKELTQFPFGGGLLLNHSIIPATLVLKAKTEDKVIYEETKNIKIRAADEMIWSLYNPWDTEYMIAAWVTPKDPMVEQILSIAKEKLYGRSLHGYIGTDVREQVRAIFNAVRDIGVSYVSSHMSFGQIGFTQRVRLPKTSILQKAANCIDGTVLLASLFENIGLEPLIIIVTKPGYAHAFVGVRLAPGSRETLFIETTLVGRPIEESLLTLEFTFDAAEKAGNAQYTEFYYMSKYNPDALHIVDIKKARKWGIYPLW